MLEYDNHTLLICHDNLDNKALTEKLESRFNNFYLNNVKNGSLGFAYIFFPNPEDYYSLVGKEETFTETLDDTLEDVGNQDHNRKWADTEMITRIIKTPATIQIEGLEFKKAFIVPPEPVFSEKFKLTVLFSPEIPQGITVKDLEEEFSKFTNVSVNFNVNKRLRSLIVTFPIGNYARFALLMCKQLNIKGKLMVFKHARY